MLWGRAAGQGRMREFPVRGSGRQRVRGKDEGLEALPTLVLSLREWKVSQGISRYCSLPLSLPLRHRYLSNYFPMLMYGKNGAPALRKLWPPPVNGWPVRGTRRRVILGVSVINKFPAPTVSNVNKKCNTSPQHSVNGCLLFSFLTRLSRREIERERLKGLRV